MKKQLSGLLAILTILGACQKNEVASLSEEATIHATIEDNDVTKTIMDESNNILWSENDHIIAFMKSSYGHKYQVKPSFVGKSYADFSVVSSGNGSDLSAGNAWDHNVVYYPFSENIECLKSGSNYALEVNLPSEQVYVHDSFANGSMAMVAVSENNNITFNNVLGAIKLQLKGTQTVKSIKIEGKNNEKLSGAAVVTAYTDGTKPMIVMNPDAATFVTLNCGSGVKLSNSTSTEFIISLPPINFKNGFNVLITSIDNCTSELYTDKQNEVLRSSLLSMPEVSLDFPYVPIESINLNVEEFSMYLNETIELSVNFSPINASEKSLIWESSDNSVITVNNGKVSAVGVGKAEVTVKTLDGNHSDKCTITVKDDPNIEKFVITTGEVSDLRSLFGTLGSSYEGFSDILGKAYKFGVCYSDINSSPNENDETIYVTSQVDGSYSFNAKLHPNTLYYFRAIVYYDGRYFYGDIKSFKTPALPLTHQAVDLGLSVKWSPCNLGAETTDVDGDYYAWGEVQTKGGKENYGRLNYEYYDSVGQTYINIGEDISGTKYDAALSVLGAPWRMPTYQEVKELYNNCEWKAATYNSKAGYLVTGPNGNSIFVITVSCTDTSSSKMRYSQFWTSTLSGISCAYYLNYSYFNVSNTFMAKESFREYGLPVRPVCD